MLCSSNVLAEQCSLRISPKCSHSPTIFQKLIKFNWWHLLLWDWHPIFSNTVPPELNFHYINEPQQLVLAHIYI